MGTRFQIWVEKGWGIGEARGLRLLAADELAELRDEGKYGVGEMSGGVGSNIVGSWVFWVGADDQPSLSRSFYRDGLFGEIWG